MPNGSAKPDAGNRLKRLRRALEARHRLTAEMRAFFGERDFLEVETPVRLQSPAMEDHIEAEPSGSWYLRTSPELQMKRLLAAGYPRVYQVGPCFRRGERGRFHLPEFSMLEWYRSQADCNAILDDTRALLKRVVPAVTGRSGLRFRGHDIALESPWQDMSVDEAFERFSPGISVDDAVAGGTFETVLVEHIEPHLGYEVPAVLRNFPLALSGLARRCRGRPDRAERWELYLAGVEIANAYSELNDPVEQASRFEASATLRRAQGREVYPLDAHFMTALQEGMPPAGGIALGVDRLLMVLLNASSMHEVVPFPPEESA